MRKFKAYLLVLMVLPAISFAQESGSEELVDWKASQRLVWSDYKGSPDQQSDAAALTATYLGIEYEITEKGFSWKIQCRFSKTRSWGKSKTDYILQHEQGHFDIAEIFARKLNKKLKDYKFDKGSFRKDLKKIYDGITSEKEKFQDKYDKETDHSRKKEEQAKWIKKIDEELKEYQSYTDYD